jgi:transcriptional regulator with XRE-family HTH domain
MSALPPVGLAEHARSIGWRIVKARRALGLTQQEVAASMRVTVQWLSRLERGRQNLTLATLVKLSNALGMRVVELVAEPLTHEAPLGRRPRGRPRSEAA